MATPAALEALLEGKRLTHPALREPLTWDALRQVCQREGIAIVSGDLPAEAVLLSSLGTAVIVLNRGLHPRRNTYRAAHELAHHWLHADHELVIYTMCDPLTHDEREDEAEYVALRLLQGW